MNSRGVTVKDEEEQMEVDTLVLSDLVHDQLLGKESMGSHNLFSNKTDNQCHGGKKMAEQLHPQAKMEEQHLHGLKKEDNLYAGGCQAASKTAENLVSGANNFQFRVKLEDPGDLTGAKMEDQLLFKTKILEQPLSAAKMNHTFFPGAKMEDHFPSGAKMEDSFASGAKMEDQFASGAKMEEQLLFGTRMADHIFSGAKMEEQLFFGAKMEDQCLRAVLWQDMSVNLASTLLHQLSGKAHTHTLTLILPF